MRFGSAGGKSWHHAHLVLYLFIRRWWTFLRLGLLPLHSRGDDRLLDAPRSPHVFLGDRQFDPFRGGAWRFSVGGSLQRRGTLNGRHSTHQFDVALIIGYVIAIYAFGLYFARHTKSTTDYFFSGRKFAWWVVAFSMIASIVGSYSFIKYSAAGYTYGLSSSMSYLNDWFFMPLWMFGWLPIMYYARISFGP